MYFFSILKMNYNLAFAMIIGILAIFVWYYLFIYSKGETFAEHFSPKKPKTKAKKEEFPDDSEFIF